jgi:hypothetical protein
MTNGVMVPGIVRAKIPQMTLGIATRIAAPTVGPVLDVEDDTGAGNLGSGAMSVSVGDKEITDLRLRTANLVGLLHQFVERG